MKYFIKIFIAPLILLTCVCSVNASVTDHQVSFEILTDNQLSEHFRSAPVYGTVSQGETKRHTYTPGNERTLEISLQWDRSTGNDLDLYVTPPNGGANLIDDEVDGRADGKISIRTSLITSTINYPWGCDVIGSRVSGTRHIR